MRGAKFWANLALLVFSSFLVAAAFEVFVRCLPQEAPRWAKTPKKYYLHESITNNRDYPISKIKPANTFRIIVIGDSFTYGVKVQLDDTFPKRLEKNLNLNINQPKVEVVNWGYPGFSTMMELPGVDNALKNFQPDLIILAMTLNDPELQLYTHPKYLDVKGNIALDGILGGISKHWKGLAFLLTRYYNYRSHQDYIKYHLDLFENSDTWGKFAASIEIIKNHCKERNVPFMAVLWPMFSYPLDENYPFRPAHEKVGNFFKEMHVPLLDLFNSFKGIPPYRIQLIPNKDSHPNEIGYRIGADAIYEFLAKKHLIPEEVIIKQVRHNRRETTPVYPK